MKLKNISKKLFVSAVATVAMIATSTVTASAEESAGDKIDVSIVRVANNSYKIEIPEIPDDDGVFFEQDIDASYHLSLAKPIGLDNSVAEKLSAEGLGCIESFVQSGLGCHSELIVYDPAQLTGKPLTLQMYGQSVQLDGASRVLQVSYVNTSGLDGEAYPANAVTTSDYLYVNGEPEKRDGLWSIPDHFYLSEELAGHLVNLISSYRAYATTREEVYNGVEQYFDGQSVVFDYEKYFKDYTEEQGVADITETFVITDTNEDGEATRTRRVFLTEDDIVVLSMSGNSCSVYSLPRSGKVLTEGNIDDWFDLPENREMLYNEHHLFRNDQEGIFFYSVIDKESRLIVNWDAFVAFRKAIEKQR